MTTEEDGSFGLTDEFTEIERRIIAYCTTHLHVNPMFKQDKLAEQLDKCLMFNKIIRENDKNLVKDMSNFISLYAVDTLHYSRVIISGGDVATLSVAVGGSSHCLEIHANIPIDMDEGEMQVTFPIFMTDLPPIDYCEPDFPAHLPWDLPIAINAQGKIAIL